MPKLNKILKEFTQYLIENGFDAIDIIEEIIYPYKGFDPRKIFNYKSKYKITLSGLEKRELINKKGDRFLLTLKGKLELIKYSSGKLKFKQSQWDKKWRIVAFDIPESKRDTRKYLREYLFYLGFKQLQKSVWITPFHIKYQDLTDLFDETITEKLSFIITDNISNEQDIKKRFDL